MVSCQWLVMILHRYWQIPNSLHAVKLTVVLVIHVTNDVIWMFCTLCCRNLDQLKSHVYRAHSTYSGAYKCFYCHSIFSTCTKLFEHYQLSVVGFRDHQTTPTIQVIFVKYTHIQSTLAYKLKSNESYKTLCYCEVYSSIHCWQLLAFWTKRFWLIFFILESVQLAHY